MNLQTPLAPHFRFWHPPVGYSVVTGADSRECRLPTIPLPILNSKATDADPSADMIGSGLYDYLRQFPDCSYNTEYAALLRDVWPHYLSDLAAMIIMLDHKEIDAPYLRRKISGLQILLLLNADNPGLLQQLGMACYDLALNYIELSCCRSHLTRAIGYFTESDRLLSNDTTNLNYMAQIDYLLGDYPQAIKKWQLLSTLIQDETTRLSLVARIEAIQGVESLDHPLVVDLESIGEAMQLLASDEPALARAILETLEQQQIVPTEFPNPEFYSLLGISRERSGEHCLAQVAFVRALELDPTHQPALDGINRYHLQGEQC